MSPVPAPSPEPSNPSRWPRLTLRRPDQAVAAVIAAASLIAIAGWCIGQGRLRGRLIDIDMAEPIAIDFKIDVNAADWPELALLPNIGEQLAKRIVEDRALRGPFRDFSDLRRVRGIGPRTLEGMQPYLLPLPSADTAAGGGDGAQSPTQMN
jgi:competence protein ComEA